VLQRLEAELVRRRRHDIRTAAEEVIMYAGDDFRTVDDTP
jgi:hypothetical protein